MNCLPKRLLSFLGLSLLTLFSVVHLWPGVALSSGQYREPERMEIAQGERVANPLQEGKQLYQAGQLAEAARVWQQAAQEYQERGDRLNQVQALNYLSIVYQDLGDWEEGEAAIAQSLGLLQGGEEEIALLAQALNAQGSLQLARGETQTALQTWQQAEELYDRAGNEPGKWGSQINQAQALQILGHHRRARILLERINEGLQAQPDSLLKADGLRSLGRALQTVGNLAQAKELLEQSWSISDRLGATAQTGATLLSIGNIARSLQQYNVALSYYQEAENKAQTEIARLQAQLNQFSLLLLAQRSDRALALLPSIQSNLSTLSPSREGVYARVNLAQSLMKRPDSTHVAQILATAVQQARQLRDPRAEAYALTQLGALYEQNQQFAEAQSLTEQATQIAQGINANDITARSSWQLGRLLKHQGNLKKAIASYQNAVDALQSLRSDLVTIDRGLQFDFKESVEPVYREFVGLLLQPGASQENLQQAREAIEALQIAELDNFFQEACVTGASEQIDRIDPHSAAIYPIILRDRLEVILSMPQGILRHYSTNLPQKDLEQTLQTLYSSFYLGYSGEERLHLSQQVYDWLIRPAEADLEQHQIKTLVFVLDGFLQSLPMGALYDGNQYLIEKYSIALSPGLQLSPEGLERTQIRALTAGLTEARQGFPPLPGVESEVKQIAAEVDAQILLNEEFTRAAFQKQVDTSAFEVVHLATHGQFSSDPDQTFLLAWDDRVNVKDFDRLLQGRKQGTRPVELLVLSACQTASGDRRAALGLAGFALRSGARSTLATLWSVSDLSTAELMSEFYQQLTRSGERITKAEALRQAQLTLLRNKTYSHPYFWAPFVLVGNWL